MVKIGFLHATREVGWPLHSIPPIIFWKKSPDFGKKFKYIQYQQD